MLDRCPRESATGAAAGDGSPEYVSGIHIPLAGAEVVVWAIAATVLFRPPSDVIARTTRPSADRPLVVWSLARLWHFFADLAVPVCGVVGAVAQLLIPTALGANPDVPANLVLGLPPTVVLKAGSIALIWSATRARCGVSS